MATFFNAITDQQADLIATAPLFFVATFSPQHDDAPKDAPQNARKKAGPVNLSPKGGVPLHVIDANTVAYLDYAGSGNETARHIRAGSPVTVMVCSFEEANAAIVRLYGHGTVLPIDNSPLAQMLLQHPATELNAKLRQIIKVQVDQTSTSCGYGVPAMRMVRERSVADRGRRFCPQP
jgi:hypothetical protein